MTIIENSCSVLSIDGGGIRGLVPCLILRELEHLINLKLKDSKWKEFFYDKTIYIQDLFDFFAGSSTGGLIVMCLLCPNDDDSVMTIDDVQRMYRYDGNKIFQPKSVFQRLFFSGKYECDGLLNIVKKIFGDRKLSDLQKPSIFLAYDIEQRKIHIFNSEKAKKSPKYDFYLVDVCMAMTAAPSYFPPQKIYNLQGDSYTLIDGGIAANNPCIRSLVECVKIYPNVPYSRYLVLSLGTGSGNTPYFFQQTERWSLFHWIAPIIDICMQAQSDQSYLDLKELIGNFSETKKFGLIRIQTILENASEEMDDFTHMNIKKLTIDSLNTIYHQQETMDMLSDRLMLGAVPEPDFFITADGIYKQSDEAFTFLDHIECGLCFFDSEGFIYSVNRSFAEKFDVKKELFSGLNIADVIPFEKIIHTVDFQDLHKKKESSIFTMNENYFSKDQWHSIFIHTNSGKTLKCKLRIVTLEKTHLKDFACFHNKHFRGYLMQIFYTNYFNELSLLETNDDITSIESMKRFYETNQKPLMIPLKWGFIKIDFRGIIIDYDIPFDIDTTTLPSGREEELQSSEDEDYHIDYSDKKSFIKNKPYTDFFYFSRKRNTPMTNIFHLTDENVSKKMIYHLRKIKWFIYEENTYKIEMKSFRILKNQEQYFFPRFEFHFVWKDNDSQYFLTPEEEQEI